MSDIIEGFVVGGSTQITVANLGHGVVLTMKSRVGETEAVLSVEQAERLRRLLRAAQRRASHDTPDNQEPTHVR